MPESAQADCLASGPLVSTDRFIVPAELPRGAVAARCQAHNEPGHLFPPRAIRPNAAFLGSASWLPAAACPAAGHYRSVALNVAHGRAVAVGGQVVGSGQVGLALDSLQIGLRPAQLEFFLAADAR